MGSETTRAAARLLLIEAAALRPVLEAAAIEDLDLPTVCAGWSVRDVLAHCGAAMTMLASGEVHRFTPADNQRDVEARRRWSLDAVLGELFAGYRSAAVAIADAGGVFDGVGLGEWMHGGDVREALGVADAYVSAGSDLALRLLLERSEQMGRPGAEAHIDGEAHRFGAGVVTGSIEADLETFVRLCGARRPDPGRYRLVGLDPSDLVLFS